MDLKRFRMKKYDDSVTTKIGELAVFNLSGMYYEELLGKLGGTITKSSPVEFVRAIIPFICYPINSLEDEKYRPTPSLILKDEDIANLSESDIEEIARIYVVNNEDL